MTYISKKKISFPNMFSKFTECMRPDMLFNYGKKEASPCCFVHYKATIVRKDSKIQCD